MSSAADVREKLERELKRGGRAGLARAFKSHERALIEYTEATRAVDEIAKTEKYAALAAELRSASAEDARMADELARKILDGKKPDKADEEIFVRLPALAQLLEGDSDLIRAFERQGRAIEAYRARVVTLERELRRPEFRKVALLAADLRRAMQAECEAAVAAGAEAEAAPEE